MMMPDMNESCVCNVKVKLEFPLEIQSNLRCSSQCCLYVFQDFVLKVWQSDVR